MFATIERTPLAVQLERALLSGLDAGARLVDVLAGLDVGLRARGWTAGLSVAVVRPHGIELAAPGGVDVTCYTASVPVRVVARARARAARLGARAHAGIGGSRALVQVVEGPLRDSVDVIAIGGSAFSARVPTAPTAPVRDDAARIAVHLLSPYLPSER